MSDPSSDFADPRPLPPGQRWVEELRPNHYGRVPSVNIDSWTLTISGATASGRETVLRWVDLCALEHIEVTADLHCASHLSHPGRRWEGVPTSAILRLAPPADDAPHVLAYAMYGFSSNIQVSDLASPRGLLATGMNGAPLPKEHGWPVRLVLPHLYGFKGPKWLVALEYHREPVRGFWEQRGYHPVGDVWREERYAHQG